MDPYFYNPNLAKLKVTKPPLTTKPNKAKINTSYSRELMRNMK